MPKDDEIEAGDWVICKGIVNEETEYPGGPVLTKMNMSWAYEASYCAEATEDHLTIFDPVYDSLRIIPRRMYPMTQATDWQVRATWDRVPSGKREAMKRRFEELKQEVGRSF
jgi:hypothetical protein